MRPPGMFRRIWANRTRGVTAFLVIAVAVHVALLVLGAFSPRLAGAAYDWAGLVPERVWTRPWTLATMALLHDRRDLLHILFNVLALFSLGPWVERALGTGRFARLFAVAALAGSAAFVLVQYVAGTPGVMAIGASGAVVGVLTAFALLFPQSELRFFGLAPMRAANLIWLMLGIDAVMLVFGASVAVSVHVGGMLGAFAYLRRPWRPAYVRDLRRRLVRLRSRLS
jgi:membrane associated rhomboid family serine protease